MLQLTVPKSNTPESATFLQQFVVTLKEGERSLAAVGTIASVMLSAPLPAPLEADLDIDLSPLRDLLAAERDRADARRAAEMRMLDLKAVLIAEQRRVAPSKRARWAAAA